MRKRLIHLVAGFLLVACASAQARLRETQLDLPVNVQDMYGKTISHTIKVTVFFDDLNPTPAPVLVLNHGRAGEAQERASLGRARYSEASKFLVERGFIVAVPTRLGYGVTGGTDVEDTGPCDRRNYPAGYAAAAQQIQAVLEAVRQRPDAAKDRAVVMGQSYGATAALTIASLNPPGVQAAINIAGGGGGNPKARPQQPCGTPQLQRMFSDYGKTARMPTLWVYTENDMYFGPRFPREWHQAFTAAGGQAKFVQFPPHGDDGHALFTKFPAVWQPVVGEFLDSVGFPAPPARGQ